MRFLVLFLVFALLAPPALAQAADYRQTVRLCPVEADQTVPPDFDRPSCESVPLDEVDPQGRALWVELTIDLSDELIASGDPLGLYLSGKMTASAWVNGQRIGSNGTPGRYLFAQNGDSTVGPMLSDLDGWNREDVTHTYDFDRDRYAAVPRAERQAAKRALREIRAAGKLTTSTDYTRNGQGRWVSRAIRSACRVGAVPFVSNIELSRVPRRAARC